MDTRFKSFENLKLIELLYSKRYSHYQNTFPDKSFENLGKSYGSFFDLFKLKNELIVFYSHPYFREVFIKYVPGILISFDLKDTFSEIFNLSSLILTIPATTSSVERSFSALKRIKTYLRNQMHEERLSELAIISIEKQFLKSLKTENCFCNEVIEIFIQKTRRIELIYK